MAQAKMTVRGSGSIGGMKELHTGQFFSSDVEVTKGSSHTADSDLVDITGAREIFLMGKVKGANAGSAGDVVFHIRASLDGENYGSSDFTTITLGLSGTAVVYGDGADSAEVEGLSSLKVVEVSNADASHNCTANLLIGLSQ